MRILLFLLILTGVILLLPLLAANSPSGALHAGVVHASAEKGVVICAPWDSECQDNPFGYPVPGE